MDIEKLIKENQELLKENKKMSDLFKYQENMYKRLLEMTQNGMRAEIKHDIGLELSAIRDLCGYIEANDARRIIKRLDRIDERLSDEW